MQETENGGAPAWARFFGEDGAAQCVELLKAYFIKPPFRGPGAAFIVYDPAAVPDPDALVAELAADVRKVLPSGVKCDLRYALGTDPGFQKIAPQVLWFDLSTGDVFQPEERKLGLARPPDAVARAASPEPAPEAAANIPPPVVTSGGVSLASRFKQPTADDIVPYYKDPAWWGKAIKNVASLMVLVGILVAGGIYLKKYIDSTNAEQANRAQAVDAAAERRAKERAEAQAKKIAERNRQAQGQSAAAKPRTAEKKPDAAEATVKKQAVAAADEWAPRSFADLMRKLDPRAMERMDQVDGPRQPYSFEPGTRYWCVFAGADGARMLRVTAGESEDHPREVVAFAERGERHAYPVENFAAEITNEAHIVLHETDMFLWLPQMPTNPAVTYPVPVKTTFLPAEAEFGKRFYDLVWKDCRSRTSRILYTVTFHFKGEREKPLEWKTDFDSGVTWSDVARRMRERYQEEDDAWRAKDQAARGTALDAQRSRNESARQRRRPAGTGETYGSRRGVRPGITSFKNNGSRSGTLGGGSISSMKGTSIDYSGFNQRDTGGGSRDDDTDDEEQDARNGTARVASDAAARAAGARPDEDRSSRAAVEREITEGWFTVAPRLKQ